MAPSERRILGAIAVAALVGLTAFVIAYLRNDNESAVPPRVATAPQGTAREEASAPPGSDAVSETATEAEEPKPPAATAPSIATTEVGSPSPDEHRTTVTGRVVDGPGGQPVSNVRVELQERSTSSEDVGEWSILGQATTGDDGTFRIERVAFGDKTWSRVSVADEYYQGWGILKAGSPLSGPIVDFGDIPAILGGTVSGRVVSPDGNPVALVSVFTWPDPDPDVPVSLGFLTPLPRDVVLANRARSAEDGRFTIRAVPPGQLWRVLARHSEIALTTSERFVVRPREETAIGDVRLAVGGSITGTVRDARGRPIEKATLVAEDSERLNSRSAYKSESFQILSGEQGGFRFSHLPAGTYSVTAKAEKHGPTRRDGIEIAEGETSAPLDLTLEDSHFLSGRISDAKGAPIPEVDVSAWAEAVNEQATSDADGRYRLENLPPTPVSVGAWKTGYRSETRESVVVDREDLDFVLKPMAAVTGRVLSPKGAPEGDARVEFRTKHRPRFARAGDTSKPETGEFSVFVEPGRYLATATHLPFAGSEAVEVIVTEGEPVPDLVLTLRPGSIVKGIVLETSSRAPDAGAPLAIVDPDAETGPRFFDLYEFGVNEVESGADGSFVLEGVPPGSVEIRAKHAQYCEGTSGPLEIAEGGTVEGVVVALSAGGAIRGTVYDDQSRPSADHQVLLIKGVSPLKETWSREGGSYELRGITPGDYLIARSPSKTASNAGSSIETVPVTVRENEVLVLDLGPKPGTAGAGCRLLGIVREGSSPLGKAQVVLVKAGSGFNVKNGRSDEQGRYEIPGLQPGRYTAQVIPQGEERSGAFTETLEVPDRSEHRVDLVAPSCGITGTVVSASTGEPLGNVSIVAIRGDASASALSLSDVFEMVGGQARTDTEGRYQIRRARPGAYQVEAGGRGLEDLTASRDDAYGRESVECTVVEGRTSTVDFRLAPGSSLSGVVRDARGAPVAFSTVRLDDGRGRSVYAILGVPSDERGNYRIVGLKAGEFTAIVTSRTQAPLRRRVRVTERESHEDFVLESGGGLTLTVATERGDAVDGASVEIVDERGEPVPTAMGLADLMAGALSAPPPGTHLFPHLVPGSYTIRASKEGVGRGSATARVADGGDTRVRLVLR